MPDLTDAIARIVGPTGILTGADAEPYCEDWRKLYHGRTQAVVRPANTEQVADVVRLCAETGTPVVPQGGNTSMVGGATPDETGRAIILSLMRMNRMRAIDPTDLTITLDAGITLKAAQMAAAEAGCLLPLSISSEGSAEIGGILATNAGGNNTGRYGNARDLLLGSRWCYRTARCGTGCGGCARTTPVTASGRSSPGRKERWASSRPRC